MTNDQWRWRGNALVTGARGLASQFVRVDEPAIQSRLSAFLPA